MKLVAKQLIGALLITLLSQLIILPQPISAADLPARKILSGNVLKAPFSGVITKKLVDLGSVVGIGTPVFEITDISQLKLTVSVPERDIQNFVLNQQVSVDVDVFPGKSFSGKVSLIGIQADKMHLLM